MKILDTVKNNPVMVRSVVVAGLSLVGAFVPELAGVEANETVIGVVLAVVAIVLGRGAHNRVTPTHVADAREEAAQLELMAARREAGDPDAR
ncbi:hypothetical protein OG401_23880 [Kitasatospora purpeofusca]|uniref:hypothetical protein n=1 Tax=Kitasatospora purpeofusca TaxID=67352 RepID=UPI0022588FCB|nr:hypothetical protein [Kitasatospora purpeofusca]MCX4687304.1 hypothetical protein [Kitasatospora purpeofusca]